MRACQRNRLILGMESPNGMARFFGTSPKTKGAFGLIIQLPAEGVGHAASRNRSPLRHQSVGRSRTFSVGKKWRLFFARLLY
jgi:hypothetical protein